MPEYGDKIEEWYVELKACGVSDDDIAFVKSIPQNLMSLISETAMLLFFKTKYLSEYDQTTVFRGVSVAMTHLMKAIELDNQENKD